MLISPLLLVLYSLTTWRITLMLAEERGPADVFEKIRASQAKNPLSPLDCFYCTSVWVAFFIGLLTGEFILYWLPLSAIAILIEVVRKKLEE